jgi:hypothetical protein
MVDLAYEALVRDERLRLGPGGAFFQHNSNLVPGLLQIEAYAQALFRVIDPDMDPDEATDRWRVRSGRAVIFDAGASFTILISETALRQPAGTSQVMSDQLSHILELIESKPNLVIRVIPLSAGIYPGCDGPYVLIDFQDGGEGLYREDSVGGRYEDAAELVARYRSIFARALEYALTRVQTRELIGRIRTEWLVQT